MLLKKDDGFGNETIGTNGIQADASKKKTPRRDVETTRSGDVQSDGEGDGFTDHSTGRSTGRSTGHWK